MCCVILAAALFPRATLVVLYLFTSFVHRAVPAPDLLYAGVGFLLAPLSFLWYCAVMNWFGGWGLLQVLVLLLCLSIDLGTGGGAAREQRRRRRRMADAA